MPRTDWDHLLYSFKCSEHLLVFVGPARELRRESCAESQVGEIIGTWTLGAVQDVETSDDGDGAVKDSDPESYQ